MISVYQLKSRFQNLLRPLGNRLAARGVTANQVTLIAIGSSILYGLLLFLDFRILWLLLPVFLFVRMALNALDGMMAREHNMKSRLGLALNEVGDVVSDAALSIPFILYTPGWALMPFIFLAAMTEMCGLTAFMMAGQRRYDGPMGKSDRAAATGLAGFLIGLGLNLRPLMPSAFGLLALLSLWTCFNRLRAGLADSQ